MLVDLPSGLQALLSETPLGRDTVFVLADWLETQGEAAADGVRHAVSWARQIGIDRHGLWAEARVGRAAYLMRWIPAGPGLLGSIPGERGRARGEPVQRPVRLRTGFWLGATPVTDGHFTALVRDDGQRRSAGDLAARHLRRDTVMRFLMRQNAGRHHPYRLPSHAEWEFACRGGSAGFVPHDWGRRWFTPRVAQEAPNRLGLHDMLSGLHEFCADLIEPTARTCVVRGGPRRPSAPGRRPAVGTRPAARKTVASDRVLPDVSFRLALGAPTVFDDR